MEQYLTDVVGYARNVLGAELFDYEVPQLRNYGEYRGTQDYYLRLRPKNRENDYLRNLYEQWEEFVENYNGGSA